jgi:hypothetical protein
MSSTARPQKRQPKEKNPSRAALRERELDAFVGAHPVAPNVPLDVDALLLAAGAVSARNPSAWLQEAQYAYRQSEAERRGGLARRVAALREALDGALQEAKTNEQLRDLEQTLTRTERAWFHEAGAYPDENAFVLQVLKRCIDEHTGSGEPFQDAVILGLDEIERRFPSLRVRDAAAALAMEDAIVECKTKTNHVESVTRLFEALGVPTHGPNAVRQAMSRAGITPRRKSHPR